MRIGILGFGNMGEALAAGLRERQPDCELAVYEKVEAQSRLAAERYGAKVCATLAEIAAASEILIVAVKPQNTDELLAGLKSVSRGARVISIVAGKRIAYFQERLGTDQVVRFMPNLAAREGKAAVGVSCATTVQADFRSQALQIAESVGIAVEVGEELLAAITGISGSGLAYAFAFVHAMALGGVQAGLSYPTALAVSLEVAEGAVALLKKSGEHPIGLLSKVTSPGGTTIAGVRALEEGGFTATVMDAVVRASQRARELES